MTQQIQMEEGNTETLELTHRQFWRTGILATSSVTGPWSLVALKRPMPSMVNRDPSDAERRMVREYHDRPAKVLFEEDFKSQTALEDNWTVLADGRSEKIISRQTFQCGLFEAYMQIADGTRAVNSFWLSPQNALNGDSFEILVAESYCPAMSRSTPHGHNFENSVERKMTGNGQPATANLADGFHDYGVFWTPGALIFCLDGNAFKTIETKGAVVSPMNLRFSMAPGGFEDEPPHDQRRLMVPVLRVRVLEL
jgi:Glycosyl hydrolases family 16